MPAPSLTRQAEGQTLMVLSWSCNEAATYRLEVDGKRVEPTEEGRYEAVVDDGEHRYSLSATDAAGNSSTQTGSFSCDATAPALQMEEPRLTRHQPGLALMRLCWNCDEEATYSLEVDGKPVELTAAGHYESIVVDSTHHYRLTATDAAGNSSCREGSVTRDFTTPSLPTPTVQVEGTQAALCWEAATDESEVSYELRYRKPGEADFTAIEPAGSPTATSHILTGLAEGDYEWSVRAVDAAGNATAWVEGAPFLVGEAAEKLYLQGAPELTAKSKGKVQAVLRWAGGTGARYTLMVDGKKVVKNKTATTWKGTLGDGEHRYELSCTGTDGRVTTLEGSFRYDTTVPTVKLTTPKLSNTGELSWTSSEEAVYSVTVDGGTEAVYTGTAPGCSLTLPEGKHSYTVTATDAMGNSSKLMKGTLTIDTTAPVLTVKPYTLKANKKTGEWNATLSWKGEKGCTYAISVDGGKAVALGSKTSYKDSLAAHEAKSFVIIATDKAGNETCSAERVLSVDTLAPVLSNMTHSMAVNTGGRAVTTLSWNCAEAGGVDYVIKVDGKTIKDAVITDDGEGHYSYEHSAALKAGKHSYSITATDWAGNKTTANDAAFTTPKLALSKPKLSDGSVPGLMNATLSWKAEAYTTYTVWVDGAEVQAVTGSKTVTCHLTDIADGAHTYRVTATNAGGNIAVAEGEFSHDNTAPTFILGALNGSAVQVKGETLTKATLGWVGEDGVSYTAKVDGKKLSVKKLKDGSVTTNTLSVTTGKLKNSIHEYSITAKDKAGNVSVISGCFSTEGGTLEWVGEPELFAGIPEGAQRLDWQAGDTAGIGGGGAGYTFELAEARQLLVKLSSLAEDATVQLRQLGGQGSVTLRANSGAGLDRELTLSAGTYYLQVQDATGAAPLASAYTLDLELEKNGSRKPMQQAMLSGGI